MHNKAKPGTQAKFHLRTLVIATIVILAIVLALAPSSIYEEAKAQGVGSGNKSVQGTVLLGTINCPAGTPGAISGPQPSAEAIDSLAKLFIKIYSKLNTSNSRF